MVVQFAVRVYFDAEESGEFCVAVQNKTTGKEIAVKTSSVLEEIEGDAAEWAELLGCKIIKDVPATKQTK